MRVAAIDVGFGTTSVTWGDGKYKIFPSRAILTSESEIEQVKNMAMANRESVYVTVDGDIYEVGAGVNAVAEGSVERNVTKSNIGSSRYKALFLGALNSIPDVDHIDFLVGGLPVNMLNKKSEIINFMKGEHIVGSRRITVKEAHIVPQPYGALTYHAATNALERGIPISQSFGKNTRLTVDPGYGTFDYLTTTGMTPDERRSGAIDLGHSAILQKCSEYLATIFGTTIPVELIDRAFQEKSLCLLGHEYSFPTHEGKFNCLPAIDKVCDDAVLSLKNKVKDGLDIFEIIVSGGPANDYKRALQKAYPQHQIIVLDKHEMAVCLGLYELAEQIGHSLEKRSNKVA